MKSGILGLRPSGHFVNLYLSNFNVLDIRSSLAKTTCGIFIKNVAKFNNLFKTVSFVEIFQLENFFLF